jgi:hypothetical protein
MLNNVPGGVFIYRYRHRHFESCDVALCKPQNDRPICLLAFFNLQLLHYNKDITLEITIMNALSRTAFAAVPRYVDIVLLYVSTKRMPSPFRPTVLLLLL